MLSQSHRDMEYVYSNRDDHPDNWLLVASLYRVHELRYVSLYQPGIRARTMWRS